MDCLTSLLLLLNGGDEDTTAAEADDELIRPRVRNDQKDPKKLRRRSWDEVYFGKGCGLRRLEQTKLLSYMHSLDFTALYTPRLI